MRLPVIGVIERRNRDAFFVKRRIEGKLAAAFTVR